MQTNQYSYFCRNKRTCLPINRVSFKCLFSILRVKHCSQNMSSLAWVVSKSYMWEHAYAYLGICNSMQMCASFVFMQKYAHILFSLNLPYILAYRPSNFGQYFFPKLMGRLIRKPTFNINKGHLFWTFLQPNLGGRLILGSAYMRVYTVIAFINLSLPFPQ